MELDALEQANHQFYAPTAVVTIGGQDLLRDLFLTVTTVIVSLSESAMGRFSITVADAFDWEAREFEARRDEERIDLLQQFAFGAPVTVRMGYGDAASTRQILTGLVTEVSTGFTDSTGVNLTISGYDKLYPLSLGTTTRHWEKQRDSDAVTEVVTGSGLSATVPPTTPVRDRIDQNETSDLTFLQQRAKANGAIYLLDGDDFYLGPRHNNLSSEIELHYGRGLVSFSPEGNLSQQISEVEVHGWSVEGGKAIVGRAKRGDETGRDARGESGGDWLNGGVFRVPTLKVRAAVRNQAEADRKARAILEERAQNFLTGHVESIGLPQIRPDTNIDLRGLGSRFSKTYYISEATHTLDGNGYRTSFTVKETTL